MPFQRSSNGVPTSFQRPSNVRDAPPLPTPLPTSPPSPLYGGGDPLEGTRGGTRERGLPTSERRNAGQGGSTSIPQQAKATDQRPAIRDTREGRDRSADEWPRARPQTAPVSTLGAPAVSDIIPPAKGRPPRSYAPARRAHTDRP